jgi:dynein heavy chain
VLWGTFIEGIRENLHIVLCMSPVGEALRVRCRKFPSLVNCCVIDWFSRWPESALREVALKFLESQSASIAAYSDQLASSCVEASVLVERACEQFLREIRRRVYTTPKSFLDHIRLYTLLM